MMPKPCSMNLVMHFTAFHPMLLILRCQAPPSFATMLSFPPNFWSIGSPRRKYCNVLHCTIRPANLFRRILLTALNVPPPLMKVLPLPNIYPARRSEEHTSELQSQSNLVCRL